MQKLFSLILTLFMVNICFSQLTVKPTASGKSNFLYVKDELLFVEGPVGLYKNTGNPNTEASLYLREEAQLLQGESGNTFNHGDGLLSVFQEGTSNAYDYNYWSSPVGNDFLSNGLFGISMLFAPESETKSSQAISVNTLDGTAHPLKISSQWLFVYTGTSYTDWQHVGNQTIIQAGHGFTMKGVNGKDPTVVNGRENNPGNSQRYDFRGRPHNGNILLFTTPGTNMLIGNPYPSALDLSLFLLENSGTGTLTTTCYGEITRKNAISGVAYFWDSKENGTSHSLDQYVGGYGAFSPVDPCTAGIYVKPIFKKYGGGSPQPPGLPASKHYDRRFSPIAQGFMVKGTTNNTLEFKNKHRVYRKEGNYSDFKNASNKASGDTREIVEIPQILFDVSLNDAYVRQLSLAFWPTATSKTDAAMDAAAYNLAPTDVGFLQDEKNYVIDIRPFDENEEIPLFLKVEKEDASISISVKELQNFSPSNIYLYDSFLDIYHAIKENSFELELEPGIYHSRFKITFLNKKEIPVVDDEIVYEEVVIFQNNNQSQLEIINTALIPLSEVTVFDLSGKQVFHKKLSSETDFMSFGTAHLRNSVYLVKILNHDGSIKTQKISVRNTP
ncbi:T9SS type A sorting domain-containing protein [Salinimicrobium sp. GXAS 041]|uniref:T9SS type A sorting domain-containing protein n=1 Tax=Salinimicrobium sp. GXAS 041 TaxID=3400806 RepID=UPI003C72399B